MASAPSASLEGLKRALLTDLAIQWLQITKHVTESETLSEAMTKQVDIDRDEIALFVPHYWAVPYHEGHGPVKNKFMVFFPNPADDPRIQGGYPVRTSDIQNLSNFMSKEEIRSARRSGKLRIIRKRLKQPGKKFFSKGAAALVQNGIAERVVQFNMDSFVRVEFPPETNPAVVLIV